MINRYYVCDNCNHSFMIKQKMSASLKKKCPECSKRALYQDLSGQHTFVYQECKTLGHQASRNTERMGKYDLEERRKKENKPKTTKSTSWYNPDGDNIKEKLNHLDTPKKKNDYIMGKE